jgi:hypothetical protein
MRFPYASSVIALVWIGAAWFAPMTNFFLFPFFTGLAVPLVERIARSGAVGQAAALAMGTAGFVNGALATLVLSFSGKLEGEALGWLGPILAEGIVLSLVGGILGAAIARTP